LVFYKTLIEEQRVEDQVMVVRLDSRYQVEWSDKISFDVICEDEDSRKTLTCHTDIVIGVMPLKAKINKGKFITIGADNNIYVSLNQGVLVTSIENFTAKILGVKEIEDGALAVVTQDGKVTFCDLVKGIKRVEIDAKVGSLDDIVLLYQQKVFFVKVGNDVAIWKFDGEHIVTLNGLEAYIDSAYKLSSKNWLVWTDDGRVSLWSEKGQRLTEFPFVFNLDSGCIELDNGRLLVSKPQNTIAIYDLVGKELHTHSDSTEVSAIFTSLTENRQTMIRQFNAKPDIDDFEHYRNFFAAKNNRFIPKDEFLKQNLHLDENSNQRKVWDFFNRPDTWQLRTVLKDTIKRCRQSEKSLDELGRQTDLSIQKLSGREKVYRVLSWILFVLGGLGLALSAGSFGLALLPALVFSLSWMLSAYKLSSARKEIKKHKSNIEVQKELLNCGHEIIANIKDYRRKLLNQVPVLKPGMDDLFSGDFITTHIHSLIHGKLKDIAMQECGIEHEDIVFHNHEPITLNTWSLIQGRERRSTIQNRIPFSNEFAVRVIKGGAIVSAVQFIQYIFLTKDKIDVFTMYYDFIAARAVAKEANAFFYRDVTNIGKKDVDRQGWLSNETSVDNDIGATEISLSVSSGEKISLTILNEDSILKINQQTKQSESISPDVEIKRLEKERQDILNDNTIPQDEKEDELQVIELRMSDAQDALQQIEVTEATNNAEEAIKNIRIQLKNHKKE